MKQNKYLAKIDTEIVSIKLFGNVAVVRIIETISANPINKRIVNKRNMPTSFSENNEKVKWPYHELTLPNAIRIKNI